MLKEKESIIITVVEKFVKNLDDDKKMFVLGFMEGIQAERELRVHAEQYEKKPA